MTHPANRGGIHGGGFVVRISSGNAQRDGMVDPGDLSTAV
jgi:hypothetical protein